MPQSIPNGDRADAVLKMNSERMRQATDEREVVLHGVNKLVLNDNLVFLSTDKSEDKEGIDGPQDKCEGKRMPKGHRGKTSSWAAASKKSCASIPLPQVCEARLGRLFNAGEVTRDKIM